jgi:hypothetical protein
VDVVGADGVRREVTIEWFTERSRLDERGDVAAGGRVAALVTGTRNLPSFWMRVSPMLLVPRLVRHVCDDPSGAASPFLMT